MGRRRGAPRPTSHPKILRVASAPIDPAWLDDEVAELERLVEAGETVEVVARLGEMIRGPRRLDTRRPRPGQRAPTAAASPPRAS